MALYAFDGTWNKDKPGTEGDTNILWFCSAYGDSGFYQKGVGTKLGKVGRIIGGITGAGGRSRVRKARKKLAANFNRGETIIDIIHDRVCLASVALRCSSHNLAYLTATAKALTVAINSPRRPSRKPPLRI